MERQRNWYRREGRGLVAAAALFVALFNTFGVPSNADPLGDLLGGEGDDCDASAESCIVYYDLDEMRDRIQSGQLELELFGKIYSIQLQPVTPNDFHTQKLQPADDFDAGVGEVDTVDGNAEADSTVFMQVGPNGVYAFILTQDETITFEPNTTQDSDTAPEETLIRRASAPADEESQGPEEEDVGTANHYRVDLVVAFDQEFDDWHSQPRSWARAIINKVNDIFLEMDEPSVPRFEIWNDAIYRCAIDPCSSTDADTLVHEFGSYLAELCRSGLPDWDCADNKRFAGHLLSGKRLDDNDAGKADLPGRYGVSMAVDFEWLASTNIQYHDGGSVLHEAAALVAHELAHNFGAVHGDGLEWDEENEPECTTQPIGPDSSNHYYGCAWYGPNPPDEKDWEWACLEHSLVYLNAWYGICPRYKPWLSKHGTIMPNSIFQNPKEEADNPGEVFYDELWFSDANKGNVYICLAFSPKWENLPLDPKGANDEYDC